MRTKLINSSEHPSEGYGDSTTERYEYECPCGKGKVIEVHDNIPGFREHDVYIVCKDCSKKYDINTSKGTRGWELVEK